jgi:Frigida-like protein
MLLFTYLFNHISDVINVLVNTGRQIDAVNLSYAFGLTEKYAPVPLLKSYLKEVRKLSNAKPGSMSPGAQVGLLVCFCIYLKQIKSLSVLTLMPDTSCKVGSIMYIACLQLEIILCIHMFPFFYSLSLFFLQVTPYIFFYLIVFAG